MFAKTLKTVLLKTATVTSFKLATPADRIGLGLRASNAYPTDGLSLGQNPMPQNSEPERFGERRTSSTQMREQMQADDGVVPPASSVGCPSSPGFTAVSLATSRPQSLTGWQRKLQAESIGGTHAFHPSLEGIRASFPGNPGLDYRFGCDCQSPDRASEQRMANGKASPATTAKK